MFDDYMFFSPYYQNAEQNAEEQRRYAELKATFELAISEEKIKLENWLKNNENRKKAHYGIVEDIFNHYHRKTKNNDELWLDHYRNMRDDLQAVNGAINGKGTQALQERAEAAKESNSPGLEITGILLTVLAAALICASIILMNPLIAYLGGIAAVAAFFTYQVGSAKVSNAQSTLFSNLSEKISPPAPLLYHDENGPLVVQEVSGYYPHIRVW